MLVEHGEAKVSGNDMLTVLLLALAAASLSPNSLIADTTSMQMERYWFNAAFESTYNSAVMYDGFARPESASYRLDSIRQSARDKGEESRDRSP